LSQLANWAIRRYNAIGIAMEPREKIAHLVRRLGLGGGAREIEKYVSLGYEGALNRLLAFDGPPKDTFHPLRPAFLEGEEDAQPGYYRFIALWIHALITTEEPLREKLAIFWHDHFAVSVNDVEHGIMNLQYMQTLREVAGRPFGEILRRMAFDPALIKQLNADTSRKGHPNENFARELVELHTVGLDQYEERDIMDIARAFSGVVIVDEYWMGGETNKERLARMEEDKSMLLGTGFVPAFHDEGEKEVLGLKGKLNPEQVLDHLAKHPLTAKHLCGKLWEYFAGTKPTPGIVEGLSAVWQRTNGDIKAVVRAITERPEFWSDSVVRTRVKSPVEFVTDQYRAYGIGDLVAPLVKPGKFSDPFPMELWAIWGGFYYLCQRLGMELLRPPSVAGWDWGQAWISTDTIAKRIETDAPLRWKKPDPAKEEYWPDEAQKRLIAYVKGLRPDSEEMIVKGIERFFDSELTEDRRAPIAAFLKQLNALTIIASGDERTLGWVLDRTYRLVRSTPEYQLC
jgi:hypothetical protein